MTKGLDNQLHLLLKKFWGYPTFRENQLDIVRACVQGQDVFAVLATGSGKSLCYQIPGLYNEGLTLVISPLIALMKDQMEGLKSRGIKADSLMSGQSYKKQDIILDNAAYGDMKFLFVSPERLKSKLFKERLKKIKLGLVAVDEAHCISEWGHDFRPEYRQIAALREDYSEVPFIALTATAKPEVREDIIQNLRLRNPYTFYGSPLRKNIAYRIETTQNKRQRLLGLVKNNPVASRIIYVSTRKLAMTLSKYLNAENVKAAAYHGGMLQKDRDVITKMWTSGETPIVIATKAFGMGIDKSDVREVIHYEMPESLEAFVQESGRAGRDGQLSQAVLLYHKSENTKIQKQIDELFPDENFLKKVYTALGQHHNLASGKASATMTPIDMESFCGKFKFPRMKCMSSLKILERQNLIKLSSGSFSPSRVMFNEFAVKRMLRNERYSDKMKSFIKLLLRTYEGIFLKMVVIDEKALAKKFGVSLAKVIEGLNWLQKYEVAKYQPNHQGTAFSFKGLKFRKDNVKINAAEIQKERASYVRRMNALMNFIQAKTCRQEIISNYFGFQNDEACGICDRCTQNEGQSKDKEICAAIISKISQKVNNIEDLISSFDFNVRNDVMNNLSYLSSERMVRIEGTEVYLID